MTVFTWGFLFRRQRFFGTTKNFRMFRFRRLISWMAVLLRAAYKCFASRSPAKLPSRSEARSQASSRSIYRSGEPHAYDQPSEAKEYLHDRPPFPAHSPPRSSFLLFFTSLLPYVLISPL